MILQALREQTRAYHDNLERKLDIFDRCRSLSDYRLLLERFYGLYLPLEARLDARSDWALLGLDFARRRKAPLLRRDLQVLEAAPDDLPLCPDLPPLDSAAQALGCLYVLEGATLGGQIIARHLHAAFGIDADSGGAFFRSYGAAVGSQWRAFGDAVTRYAAGENAQQAVIVRSACDTFAAFDRWLERGS